MGNVKQVKVDNWGVFFLQRLKNFFNNTEYCDLTLQFQDCAQLKVHRLVLNACTKYFELLESTCEMYDDVLIMPDDLQADVVVPIVNFMYTGQLEYDNNIFHRLYSTARVMNMTVLVKLLDSQKIPNETQEEMVIMNEQLANKSYVSKPSTSDDFNNFDKKNIMAARKYGPGPGHKLDTSAKSNYTDSDAGRPTRYELPEELDNDEIFDTSFADISYESLARKKTVKRKNSTDNPPPNIYDESSSSRKFEELKKVMYKRSRISPETSVSKRIDLEQANEYAFQQKLRSEYINRDSLSDDDNGADMFHVSSVDSEKSTYTKVENANDSVFNNINNYRPSKEKEDKINDKNVSLSHAKIISEVLKKYPHLVKSDKNIKLKIMTKTEKSTPQNYILEPNKKLTPAALYNQKANQIGEPKKPEWIYVSRHDNIESVANLISMGAENTTGPWLCLICGTPNKAMKFLTYHSYYKHLVEVHRQRIAPKICEYCGFKSGKRNHLLHHMYTKHNIPPPSHYHFPKCDQCSYIALTDAFLTKHKISHVTSKFACLVCDTNFKSRTQLVNHIYLSGHKLTEDKQATKCVYCNKAFSRASALYAHIRVAHGDKVRNSTMEYEENEYILNVPKYEYDEQQEEHVKIKQEYDGKIQIISNTQIHKPFLKSPQKLLNASLTDKSKDKINVFESSSSQIKRKELCQRNETNKKFGNTSRHGNNVDLVDVVVLNENEYILENEEHSLEQEIDQEQMNLENEEMIVPDILEDDCKMSKIKGKQNKITNVVNIQNQPVQYVLSGSDSQYKNLVSNAQIIYNNSVKTDITDASKYLQGQIGNIQLENARPGEVMVLNEEDFQIACSESVPNHSSNIVVVYSHPVEGSKQYIELSNQQYEASNNTQEQLQVQEECEPSTNVSEQEVVHETVETWQEETVEETIDEHIEEPSQELGNDSMVIEENSNVNYDIEEVKLSDDGKISEEEIIPLETSEVEIPLNDSGDSQVIENGAEAMECEDVAEVPISEDCIEHIETNNSHDYAQQQKDETDATDNIQSIASTEPESDAKAKLSNDSTSLSDLHVESTVQNESDKMNESIEVEESIENIQEEIKKQEFNKPENNTLVETTDEVAKTESNELLKNTDNLGSVESNGTEEATLKADDKEAEEEQAEEEPIESDEFPPEIVEKDAKAAVVPSGVIKSVERISHLLNEWEDNDSQTEDNVSETNETVELTESENKESQDTEPQDAVDVTEDEKSETVIKELPTKEIEESEESESKDVVETKEAKDTNIEKLVSDWDDDEEK